MFRIGKSEKRSIEHIIKAIADVREILSKSPFTHQQEVYESFFGELLPSLEYLKQQETVSEHDQELLKHLTAIKSVVGKSFSIITQLDMDAGENASADKAINKNVNIEKHDLKGRFAVIFGHSSVIRNYLDLHMSGKGPGTMTR